MAEGAGDLMGRTGVWAGGAAVAGLLAGVLVAPAPEPQVVREVTTETATEIVTEEIVPAETSQQVRRLRRQRDQARQRANRLSGQQPAAPAPAPEQTYFANCDAARAAGAAPVYDGDAGYGSHLDRDGDGVGCE